MNDEILLCFTVSLVCVSLQCTVCKIRTIYEANCKYCENLWTFIMVTKGASDVIDGATFWTISMTLTHNS